MVEDISKIRKVRAAGDRTLRVRFFGEQQARVAWPVEAKWGRLDLSSSTLRRIAEEQRR